MYPHCFTGRIDECVWWSLPSSFRYTWPVGKG